MRARWFCLGILLAAFLVANVAPATAARPKLTIGEAHRVAGDIGYKAAKRHGAWGVRQSWSGPCRRYSRTRIRCWIRWEFFTRRGSHHWECRRKVNMKLRGRWIYFHKMKPMHCRDLDSHVG